MLSPFIRKLRFGARLTEDDEALLARLAEPARLLERGDIEAEGAEPRTVVLILEGWACRYKLLEDGKRQITAVFLPGDVCDTFGALPRPIGHALAAITSVTVARVAPGSLRAAARTSPRIEEALWWALLLTEAITREHMVSLGRRSATERLAHVFCDFHARLSLVGRVEQGAFNLPLTQLDLADLSGLSAVHVNRSLQELRGIGLISLHDRRLFIHDVNALRELSMFDPRIFPVPPRDSAGTPVLPAGVG